MSLATRERLARLFPDEGPATDLLEEECADNLPFQQDATPESLERIRFAALELSGGTLSGLRDAIALAKTDWRDLLVAAGFADQV